MENMFQLGSFVEFNGLLAVIVGLSGENGVPDDTWRFGLVSRRGNESAKAVKVIKSQSSGLCRQNIVYPLRLL